MAHFEFPVLKKSDVELSLTAVVLENNQQSEDQSSVDSTVIVSPELQNKEPLERLNQSESILSPSSSAQPEVGTPGSSSAVQLEVGTLRSPSEPETREPLERSIASMSFSSSSQSEMETSGSSSLSAQTEMETSGSSSSSTQPEVVNPASSSSSVPPEVEASSVSSTTNRKSERSAFWFLPRGISEEDWEEVPSEVKNFVLSLNFKFGNLTVLHETQSKNEKEYKKEIQELKDKLGESEEKLKMQESESRKREDDLNEEIKTVKDEVIRATNQLAEFEKALEENGKLEETLVKQMEEAKKWEKISLKLEAFVRNVKRDDFPNIPEANEDMTEDFVEEFLAQVLAIMKEGINTKKLLEVKNGIIKRSMQDFWSSDAVMDLENASSNNATPVVSQDIDTSLEQEVSQGPEVQENRGSPRMSIGSAEGTEVSSPQITEDNEVISGMNIAVESNSLDSEDPNGVTADFNVTTALSMNASADNILSRIVMPPISSSERKGTPKTQVLTKDPDKASNGNEITPIKIEKEDHPNQLSKDSKSSGADVQNARIEDANVRETETPGGPTLPEGQNKSSKRKRKQGNLRDSSGTPRDPPTSALPTPKWSDALCGKTTSRNQNQILQNQNASDEGPLDPDSNSYSVDFPSLKSSISQGSTRRSSKPAKKKVRFDLK